MSLSKSWTGINPTIYNIQMLAATEAIQKMCIVCKRVLKTELRI